MGAQGTQDPNYKSAYSLTGLRRLRGLISKVLIGVISALNLLTPPRHLPAHA